MLREDEAIHLGIASDLGDGRMKNCFIGISEKEQIGLKTVVMFEIGQLILI